MEQKVYPVFRRMDANIIPGMNAATIFMVFAAMIAGVLLFSVLGLITKSAEVELSYQEKTEYSMHLDQIQSALVYEELSKVVPANMEEAAQIEAELNSLRQYSLVGLSDEEIKALALESSEYGITKNTSTEDFSSLIPATKTSQVPVIPDFYRGCICAIPALLIGAVRFEMEGRSLYRYIKQFAKYHASQKVYFYR